jgi:mannobiose 2-epimerase
MKEVLEQYRREMKQELEHILTYWMKFAIDQENGGFVGKIDHDNKIYPNAPKGSVLNSRILWTFSAAYNLTKKQEYLTVAERAFQYLTEYFIDKEFGGVYWTVDYKGNPLDTKKQIYALSFAVYGLSEYYQASKNEKALQSALSIYRDIVRHSYDEKNGGYIEALTRDWKETGDLRLSAKDANEKKSMNTHLHILEGFANLHRVSPTELLEVQLHELIRLFTERIISKKTNHLVLFFDDEWNERSQVISYGHDIEAAWLVQEAAEIIKDESLLLKVKERSLALTKAAAEGLDEDGGLWYEYDPEQHHLTKQKHSWPQAEAMIGFFNAWQNAGNKTFLRQSLKSWEFVKKYMHDKTGGEWYWGVHDDYSPMNKEDKAGIWKCPYHNSRACIEIINRINSIID